MDYQKTITELRAGYIPADNVEYGQGYREPITYQATLYVTDDQMVILRKLVTNELNRVRKALKKPLSSKQKRKLEDLEGDIVAIQKTISEITW